MQLIDALQWRYAAKQYVADKPVSSSDIDDIKKAIQLAPSSFGLQLFEVMDVRDKPLREKLRAQAYGQPQVTDAAHFFVFCHRSTFTREDVAAYAKRKADAQGVAVETLQSMEEDIFNALQKKSPEAQLQWMARQVYIALGHAIVACALKQIDASPMEGFDNQSFDRLLGLDKKGLRSVVVLAIGYRSDDDETQHTAKVRKTLTDLFTTV